MKQSKLLAKLKAQNILRSAVVGSVVVATAAHAAVPAAITSAIDTFETDATSLLEQGMLVAIAITGTFVIWRLAKRVFGKAAG